LSENREKVVEAIVAKFHGGLDERSFMQVDEEIFGSYVFPAISRDIILEGKVPQLGSAGQGVASSSLQRFLEKDLKVLDQLLYDKHRINLSTETLRRELAMRISGGKISAEDLLSACHASAKVIINLSGSSSEITAFDNVGQYIFQADFGHTIECYRQEYGHMPVRLGDKNSVSRAVDELMTLIMNRWSPHRVDEREKAISYDLPSFEKLPALRAQLKVLMCQMAIREKLFERDAIYGPAEDAHMKFFRFIDLEVFGQDIKRFLVKYNEASKWLGQDSRRAMRAELDSQEVLKGLEGLYQFMESIYAEFLVGQVIHGLTEDKQDVRGEVRMRAMNIVTKEEIRPLLIGIEARLQVDGLGKREAKVDLADVMLAANLGGLDRNIETLITRLHSTRVGVNEVLEIENN